MTDYIPRHRKNALVRTSPRLQPAPRHRSDRVLERLGAEHPDIKALMQEVFAPSPFRRGGAR